MVESIIAYLAGLSPIIPQALMIMGLLVVLAQTYIAITPTQDDDAWFAKLEAIPLVGDLIKAVVAFAPIQRKQ